MHTRQTRHKHHAFQQYTQYFCKPNGRLSDSPCGEPTEPRIPQERLGAAHDLHVPHPSVTGDHLHVGADLVVEEASGSTTNLGPTIYTGKAVR